LSGGTTVNHDKPQSGETYPGRETNPRSPKHPNTTAFVGSNQVQGKVNINVFDEIGLTDFFQVTEI
jgi:hypothetical protein